MSVKELFRFPASRLSRRITFWVFISVIVIETLIFIPSYKSREKELLSQLKEISLARVALSMQITKPNASDSELFQHVKKLQDNKMIVGGALYRLGGEKVGAFGKIPELEIENLQSAGMTCLSNRDGSYCDIAFSPVELQRDYRLILRHDSSSVKQRLLAFFCELLGWW